jgi:hypothetical protein
MVWSRAWFLAVMVAAATAIRVAQGQFGVGGMDGLNNPTTLATNRIVQRELGIDEELAKKLNTLASEFRAAQQQAYRNEGVDPNPSPTASAREKNGAKMTAANAKVNGEFMPKVKELLSPEQFNRLSQINIQRQGAAALARTEIANALKLTEGQKKKIADILAEYVRNEREAFVNDKSGKAFAKANELRAKRDESAAAILSAEQQAIFDSLKGPHFDFRGGFQRK